MGYFRTIWQFAERLKETMRNGNPSDAEIMKLIEHLEYAEQDAEYFESTWSGPDDEHPMLVSSIKSWQCSLTELIAINNTRKRVTRLSQIHMNVCDFLHAHGKRFGYVLQSVASDKEMWKAGSDLVSFKPGFFL